MTTYDSLEVTRWSAGIVSGKTPLGGKVEEVRTSGFLWWRKKTRKVRPWGYNNGLPIFLDTGEFTSFRVGELIRAERVKAQIEWESVR